MSKPFYISDKRWIRERSHLNGKASNLGEKNINVYNYLYGRLNIIDGKVGSLLSSNAIFLAVAGVLGFKFFANIEQLSLYVIMLSVILWFISTISCFYISFLKWEYLDDTASNNNTYIDKIISVTVMRTCLYNIAVASMLVSFLLFSCIALKYFWYLNSACLTKCSS